MERKMGIGYEKKIRLLRAEEDRKNEKIKIQ